MWVERTKQGKYKYTERYKDALTGKYRRVSIVLDKNTRQAQKQAQAALQERIKAAMEPQKKDVTLSQLVELYYTDQKKTLKPSTYDRNYKVCKSIRDILSPDILVSNLTSGYIRKRFMGSGKKNVTLNEYLTRFKALIRWAYKMDYTDDISYLDKIERFADDPHRIKIQDKFLESDELSTLLKGIEIKKWRDLTEFLALSGLRFGEAAALELSDVDLKERIIHVNKTYDQAHDIVTSTKTQRSNRDVYMQDQLYKLCRRLKAERIGLNVITLSKIFFPGTRRNHIEFDSYAKYLRETSQKVIGRRITPHTLRHTHASLLMEKGVDIDTISHRLGHADSRITKEIYLHVTNALKEKENKKIKGIKIL